ncbi:MAG: AAA family ATPase [bacterium]|nr:AAA family ATPase [bacterium]
MYTENALAGNSSQIASYRKSDNYQQKYREGDHADYANQFKGKMLEKLGGDRFAKYSEERFSEILDGKFGDSPELQVTRRDYKRGPNEDLAKQKLIHKLAKAEFVNAQEKTKDRFLRNQNLSNIDKTEFKSQQKKALKSFTDAQKKDLNAFKENAKKTRNSTIGFEGNWANSKSLSVQGLVFDDENFLKGHLAGDTAIAEFTEKYLLEYRMTGTEIKACQEAGVDVPVLKLVDPKKDVWMVKGDNMMWVQCMHTVSRPNEKGDGGLDPQIHSHSTRATHTVDCAGSLRAIAFGKVYENQHLLDAIGKTAERLFLEDKGYVFYDTKDGYELSGFSRNDIEVFADGSSLRIPEWISSQNKLREDPSHPKHGIYLDINSKHDRDTANAASRGGKDSFDFSAFDDPINDAATGLAAAQAWWKYKAENPLNKELHPVFIEDLRKRVELAQEYGRAHRLEKRTPELAYQMASQGLTERISTIRSKEALLTQMLKEGLYQLEPEILQQKIEEKILSGELIMQNDGRSLTTRELVECEQKIERLVKENFARFKPVCDRALFDAIVLQYEAEKGFKLSKGQKEATYMALTTTSGISVVLGRAGTGKSTSMDLLQRCAEASRVRVFGQAPSGKAKEALADSVYLREKTNGSGMDTYFPHVITTQKAALSEKWWEENIQKGSIVIIDEAGLVDARSMLELLEKANEHQCRIILSGDYDQYHSVGAGAPLKHVSDFIRGNPSENAFKELTEMQRGKDQETIKIHSLCFKSPAEGLVYMSEKNRIVVRNTEDECLKEMATYYNELTEAARDNTFCITKTNEDRRLLNIAIREKIGIEKTRGLEINSFERFGNLTTQDLRNPAQYESGSTVFFNMNSPHSPFQKGEACEVLRVEGSIVKLARTITDKNGLNPKTVEYDYSPMTQSAGVSLGVEERIKICPGERIRFTAANEKLGILNGDRGIVENIDFEKRIATVKIVSTSKIIKVPLPDQGRGLSIRWGYSATGHSSQGGTASTKIFSNPDGTKEDPTISNRAQVLMYVPRKDRGDYNSIYTNSTRSVMGPRSVVLFTDARNVEDVEKTFLEVGVKLVHDRAIEPTKEELAKRLNDEKPILLKSAFVNGNDAWNSKTRCEYIRPEKDLITGQFSKPPSLLEQLKSARETIGPEIGLMGSPKFKKQVIELIVENNLDIRITNEKGGLQALQDTLWATKNNKEALKEFAINLAEPEVEKTKIKEIEVVKIEPVREREKEKYYGREM